MQMKSTEAKFARRRFDGVVRRRLTEMTSSTKRFPSVPRILKRKFITMIEMHEARFGDSEGCIVVFPCSGLLGTMVCRNLGRYTWKGEKKKNVKKANVVVDKFSLCS